MSRVVKFALLIITLTAAGFTHAEAQDKPKKITIGYLNLVNAQLVTKGLGLHEKAMPGIEFEWIKIGGGGDMLRAIAGKQVDFGGIGNPPSAIGVTRGLPIKGIFVLNMLGYVEALAVRTSKNIKSIKDLAGKTVAAPFGSTTHYLLMTALRDAGVDASSVKMLDLNPGDIALAGRAGISMPRGSGSPTSTRPSRTAGKSWLIAAKWPSGVTPLGTLRSSWTTSPRNIPISW